ncbi:MAG: hypothetical protein ACTSXU_00625 [Promethearchaeota archaeon]
MISSSLIEYHHLSPQATSGFWFHGIRLKNAMIILITDKDDGLPALGSIAICAPTFINQKPFVSSTIPISDYKHEVLAKSISEIFGRKLGMVTLLFLDVKTNVNDIASIKELKLGSLEFIKMVREKFKIKSVNNQA